MITDQNAAPTAAPAPEGEHHRKIRVALVFGGRSSEHSISCATAAGVMRAIDQDKYEVVPIGIARDGHWVLVGDDLEALSLGGGREPEVPGEGARVMMPFGQDNHELSILEPGRPPRALGDVDVVLPLLHGPFGEDGTIQGLFEMADIRYVGCGVTSSAVMMDKAFMKQTFEAAGLAVGPYVTITDRRWRHGRDEALAEVEALGFPVFVKPARAGSSQGITKVTDASGLVAAIEEARRHDPKVVVEKGLVGRELECGVLDGRGGARPRVSEVGEIVVSGHDFYDYRAKYFDEQSVQISAPAQVDPALRDEIRRQALVAFEAADCEGLARVDFFACEDGQLLINEINTMPGFTPFSMYPQVWLASGIGYAELIDELVALAMERPLGLR